MKKKKKKRKLPRFRSVSVSLGAEEVQSENSISLVAGKILIFTGEDCNVVLYSHIHD